MSVSRPSETAVQSDKDVDGSGKGWHCLVDKLQTLNEILMPGWRGRLTGETEISRTRMRGGGRSRWQEACD